MPKTAHYTYDETLEALRGIGLKAGDNVFIQSNLGRFGRLKGAKTKQEYYDNFKNAVFEIIGNKGTLVIPTFSYSFFNGDIFDPETTSSTTGVLSEFAINDTDFIRSEDPNFSVAASGLMSQYFTENPDEHSFGGDSFWQRFLLAKGKFVTFNLEDSFLTFRHYIEKIHGVPYRYDKLFRGKVKINGEIRDRAYFHFVRDLSNPKYVPDRRKFHELAAAMNVVNEVELGKGFINLITANDALRVGEIGLKQDKCFFIKAEKANFEIKPQLNRYFDRLFPINRSLTGDGNRKTLKILQELADIEIKEVKSGTNCFDWTIPPEWNIKQAWVKDSRGIKVIDFEINNLHVLGYSIPVHRKMTFEELKENLFTLPQQPEAIPYLTSYYKERWGFCLSQVHYESLDKNGIYEVFIDSNLDADGSMTYGEALLQGETDKEILISTYICHPSLANNELSGPLVSAFLYKQLKKKSVLRYTYRFIFVPETIGSIYYLSQHGEHLKKSLIAGLVITCAGDDGHFTYKKSRQGDSIVDRAAALLLDHTEESYNSYDFFPSGSDERQFCSAGFNLPVGSLMRTMYGKYDEYHTSMDNKKVISFEALEETIEKYEQLLFILENNRTLKGIVQFCEPQLGKRGLYPDIGSQKERQDDINSMMWILNYSDGNNDILDIAEVSKISPLKLIKVVEKLRAKGLIEYVNDPKIIN